MTRFRRPLNSFRHMLSYSMLLFSLSE